MLKKNPKSSKISKNLKKVINIFKKSKKKPNKSQNIPKNIKKNPENVNKKNLKFSKIGKSPEK